MFLGRFFHTVDAKGRIAVPAALRSSLLEKYGSEDLFVTIYKEKEERILHVHPRSAWEALVAKAESGSGFKANLNEFRRVYVAGAVEAVPDKQGRVTLSAEHRRWAAIEQEAVLVAGGLPRMELWSRATWDRWLERSADRVFEEAQDVLETIGL